MWIICDNNVYVLMLNCGLCVFYVN